MPQCQSRTKRSAVFLDRDGTINCDPGYLSKAEHFRFLPHVKRALKLLADRGFLLFVISNQSGIARGLIRREDLEDIHRTMERRLAECGVVLDGIYFCPHRPEDRCRCRKPSPAMIRKAEAGHRLDLARSFMVGDKPTDVLTGKNAGLKTVLVGAGKTPAGQADEPDYRAKDLWQAARWITGKRQ